MRSPHTRNPDSVPTIVCDLAGVLLDWDPTRVVAPILGPDTPAFLAEVSATRWHRRHDEGLPLDLRLNAFRTDREDFARAARAWTERFVDMYAGPLAGAANLVRLARGRVRVFVLSNAPSGLWPDLLHRFPLLEEVEGAILSGDVGACKPDPAVYSALVKRFAVGPQRLFLDDRLENCTAAIQEGFCALHVESGLVPALPRIAAWIEECNASRPLN
jgi:2-haloacid dehalogenase